jgi:hypothetical protein
MPKAFALYRARMRGLEPRRGGSLEEMHALVDRAQADGLPAAELAWLRPLCEAGPAAACCLMMLPSSG